MAEPFFSTKLISILPALLLFWSPISFEKFVVTAEDRTHGAGGQVTVFVEIPTGIEDIESVGIERSESGDGGFQEMARLGPGVTRYLDEQDICDGRSYFYRAVAYHAGGTLVSNVYGPVESRGLWFKEGALFLFLLSTLVLLALLYFVLRARSGKPMYIRPVPGLRAIEEAVGRSTEMGKPILYCSGVAPLSCPGVLASLTVLGWVAEKVAQYGASLTYPVNNALNLTAGQEIVKESYLRAGRPELYSDDMVYFISGEQFAYAAAVCGVMERDRPAANFFFGSFWSEALVLAESGAATGAMQIAALDTEHQIPFFVATCDYVIIGEEFYAASAYLSDDPTVKSSLKAQDVIKAVILLLIVAGVVLSTLENVTDLDFSGFFEFFER